MDARPPVSIYLIAHNSAETLDFYVKGLGATEIMRWVDPENGKIGHSEFTINGQHLFMADGYKVMDSIGVRSPRVLGGTSVNIWIEVDDVETALARALDAGAKLLVPMERNPDGGRRARIADPAGHTWTLASD